MDHEENCGKTHWIEHRYQDSGERLWVCDNCDGGLFEKPSPELITEIREVKFTPIDECDCSAPPNIWELHDGRCEWKKSIIRKIRFYEPCMCECHGFGECVKKST